MSFIAQNLSALFANYCVYKKVHFQLKLGQSLAVCGTNGSGKTTLLKQLCGLIAPNNGQIFYFDQSIVKNKKFQSQMVYISHQVYLKDNLSVKDNLYWLALLHTENLSINYQEVLDRLQLNVLLEQKVGNLSEGQKKRIFLSQLFFPQKLLWILDEPTNSLDHQSKIWFTKMLTSHCQSGAMAIITTHEQADFADQLLKLD